MIGLQRIFLQKMQDFRDILTLYCVEYPTDVTVL